MMSMNDSISKQPLSLVLLSWKIDPRGKRYAKRDNTSKRLVEIGDSRGYYLLIDLRCEQQQIRWWRLINQLTKSAISLEKTVMPRRTIEKKVKGRYTKVIGRGLNKKMMMIMVSL